MANSLGVSWLWNRWCLPLSCALNSTFAFVLEWESFQLQVSTRFVVMPWIGKVLPLKNHWKNVFQKESHLPFAVFHGLCLSEGVQIYDLFHWCLGRYIVNLVKDHPTGHVDCFGKGVPWDMTSIFLYTASPKTKPSSLVVMNPWHGSSYFVWFWTSVYYAFTVPIVW